ncbi:MAG: GNAT family N-acetyltransferase [Candidatus Symbiobacter sp.]|nr:GNAT family N-acetyltransferase [Candidatus Symbiobacter sp.]
MSATTPPPQSLAQSLPRRATYPSRIRLVQKSPDDVKIMTYLHGICFMPGWSEELMAQTIFSPVNLAVFALVSPPRQDEMIAGFLIAQAVVDPASGGEAEILSFGVLPDYRRQGLARLLLHDITRRLAGLGARRLFLEVAVTNLAARRLYENSGFRPVGERKNYYPLPTGQSEDALVLRRDLAV